jgi:ribosomal protein S28E/S33
MFEKIQPAQPAGWRRGADLDVTRVRHREMPGATTGRLLERIMVGPVSAGAAVLTKFN